jgi:hypothetical protein
LTNAAVDLSTLVRDLPEDNDSRSIDRTFAGGLFSTGAAFCAQTRDALASSRAARQGLMDKFIGRNLL